MNIGIENKAMHKIEKSECFGIDISLVKDFPFFKGYKKTLKRLDAGSIWNLGNPVTIDADPFLFSYNERLYLFYEDMHFYTTGGAIKMISTDDLKHWTKPVLITHEPTTHFSFPFVFEDNGVVYMIPETGWSGEIRLYRAINDDLTEFVKDSVIFRRWPKPQHIIFDYADNIIYKKNGIYYLFTSILDDKGYQLRLYISESLRGNYKEHPCSPICHDLEFGRNAGCLIEKDDKLFRPSQDCSDVYGGQVNLLLIKELTPEIYKEVVVAKGLLPQSDPFYKQGGHQLNFARFKGQIIMATDAKRDRAFYGTRIFHKILRILKLSNK